MITRLITFHTPVPIPNNFPLSHFEGAAEITEAGVEFDHLFYEGGPRFSVVVPMSNIVSIVTDYNQEQS